MNRRVLNVCDGESEINALECGTDESHDNIVTLKPIRMGHCTLYQCNDPSDEDKTILYEDLTLEYK